MPFSTPSFQTRAYYCVKPFIPRRIRWSLRRRLARKILRNCAAVWPINEAAGKLPDAWPGWPDGKRFAVVLTHDVESQAGLDQVRPLAELEMKFGFRSAFNFIPEGDYRVPEELRTWLGEHGFEVGIHDLHHNGSLYSSRGRFREKANRINRYLKEWKAFGFRSGFMLRRLDWLHDLEISYDCSTFDTDPFEPQSDGAGTVFPFRVTKSDSDEESSYIEMPYTLPQDSTLYMLLEEKTPEIWNQKLDWLAEKGGMVLINVHPDYMSFGENVTHGEGYPASHYKAWLEYLKTTHSGSYWHALPKDVASYAEEVLPESFDKEHRYADRG